MKVFLFALLSTVAAVLLWAIWTEAFVDGLIFTLGLVTTALCGYLVADYFYTSEKRNFQSDVDMYKREITALKEESDILRKQASLMIPHSEIDELRRRMQLAEEERNKIHGEFLAQAANISALNTRLKALQKEYNRLSEDATITSESRLTELEAIRDTLALSKTKLNELAQENKALRLELERYKQRVQQQESKATQAIEEPKVEVIKPIEIPQPLPIEPLAQHIEPQIPIVEPISLAEVASDDIVFLNNNNDRIELRSHRKRSRSADDAEKSIQVPIQNAAPIIPLKPISETVENEEEEHSISESEIGAPEPSSSSNSHSMEMLPEDLKVVEGIGPKIELLLKESGIKGLKDLSVVPVENLKEILAKGGSRYRLNDPTSWPEQARLLINGELDKFKTLTSDLFKKS